MNLIFQVKLGDMDVLAADFGNVLGTQVLIFGRIIERGHRLAAGGFAHRQSEPYVFYGGRIAMQRFADRGRSDWCFSQSILDRRCHRINGPSGVSSEQVLNLYRP